MAETEASPLVMQIVVRRDLLEVCIFSRFILVVSLSSHILFICVRVGGRMGCRTVDGAGGACNCRCEYKRPSSFSLSLMLTVHLE